MDRQIEIAWAAGFLDGEGYVGLSRCRHKGNTYDHFQVLVDVAQKRPAPLHKLVSLFGGRVVQRKNWYGTIFTWRLYGARAGVCLGQVLPYLVSKRQQAELVLEYLALPPRRRGNNQYRSEQDLAVLREQEALWLACRQLNSRRGAHAERLSEKALGESRDDAIVRSHEKLNRERLAEMSSPSRVQ